MDEYHAEAVAAASIAFEAGQLLLGLRSRPGTPDVSTSGRSADVDADELIATRLAARFPADAVLSEEAEDSPARLANERVWIVDPLDGTREYNEESRRDWAVHIALAVGRRLVAGAVAMPAAGTLYSTIAPFPAPGRDDGELRVVVSRTRPPPEAERVGRLLGATLVPMGSAGAKAMAVVRGEADAYLHAGGQWEWDSAAPVAVATASDLHASRIDGSPFDWNQDHPYQPDLLICRRAVAARLLDAIGSRAG